MASTQVADCCHCTLPHRSKCCAWGCFTQRGLAGGVSGGYAHYYCHHHFGRMLHTNEANAAYMQRADLGSSSRQPGTQWKPLGSTACGQVWQTCTCYTHFTHTPELTRTGGPAQHAQRSMHAPHMYRACLYGTTSTAMCLSGGCLLHIGPPNKPSEPCPAGLRIPSLIHHSSSITPYG